MTCARPDCSREVVRKVNQGRPPTHCSTRCRQTAYNRRKGHNRPSYIGYEGVLEAARWLLGGVCQHCGSETNLHFHHAVGVKAFEIPCKAAVKHWRVVLDELSKCILLCHRCHVLEHCRWRRLDISLPTSVTPYV